MSDHDRQRTSQGCDIWCCDQDPNVCVLCLTWLLQMPPKRNNPPADNLRELHEALGQSAAALEAMRQFNSARVIRRLQQGLTQLHSAIRSLNAAVEPSRSASPGPGTHRQRDGVRSPGPSPKRPCRGEEVVPRTGRTNSAKASTLGVGGDNVGTAAGQTGSAS